MRYLLMGLALLLGLSASSCTSYEPRHVSVGIGVNVPMYPHLVLVPGYPVYYDPRVNANYFFYDGMYWVFANDNWYASVWYNGPWDFVVRDYVPIYILSVPVRYYRHPPAYFRGWHPDSAPHWGERWGHDWERRQNRLVQQEHHYAPAPLPTYQREYSGERYPRETSRQQTIRSENYRYQPREAVTQQHFKQSGKGLDKSREERGQGGNQDDRGRGRR